MKSLAEQRLSARRTSRNVCQILPFDSQIFVPVFSLLCPNFNDWRMLGVAQCLLASPQNVSMAVVSSFAKVSMSRGTTNYILPSLPLLRSLALVQYAIHSNNLNFCYLKLEEEEIKALTSSEKPLILLRPWERNES